MNYVGRFIGNLKGFYSGINGATLTGAIDVVVVEQEDGTYKCSPFHVRFGKLGVLRSKEKVVDIEINGEQVPIRMKLGDSGEAFFVQEVDGYYYDDAFLATSPLPASPQLSDSDQRTKIGEDSDEGKIILQRTIEPLILAIEKEEAAEAEKNDDLKGRKKKRRRRRNQGSRSNIILEPVHDVDQESVEPMDTMFKMDEELSQSTVSDNDSNTAALALMSQSRSYHRDFYSDTEVDATGSPQNSRPSTPVQSDSEYEISKAHIQKVEETEEVGKWPWGELPSTGANTPAITPLVQADGTVVQTVGTTLNPEDVVSSDEEGQAAGKPSIMGRLFPFMSSKRHSSGSNATAASALVDSPAGVYLDDLNFEKMDPEVAALYFPKFDRDSRDASRHEKDDDAESGKGSSLPQSPAPGSPRSSMLSSYMEDSKSLQDIPIEGRFEAISICSNPSALFEQCQLTYDELCENPEMVLKAPPDSIFVKMDGKTIPWSVALPHLLSTAFFKRPLPPQLYERLVNHYVKTEDSTSQPSDVTVITTTAAATTTVVSGPPALPQSLDSSGSIERSNSVSSASGRRYSSWLPWRRSQNPDDQPESPTSPKTLTASAEVSYGFDVKTQDDADSTTSAPSSPYGKVRHNTSSSSSDESESGAQDGTTIRMKNPNISPARSRPVSLPIGVGGVEKEKYRKSLRLTTEQIVALNLQYGRNEATFSVTTAYQGTTTAKCHIYLWRYDDRIVVSDIDGTITKSDVLGHILPIIGQDWAQSGVAQLFTQIQHNGYKMLYLSARAIGQAQTTREYLRSIKQGDVTLPDGPLLLNPTSLMSALHREVIEKKPEEFKIACLRDIQTLFPTNPLYAGYGNKINDVFAYRAVEIAVPRIFTINHKGELRHALTNTFQSSYTSLVELAEYIFPAYKVPHMSIEGQHIKQSVTMTDGYSHFEFWRTPVSDIPDEVKVETITKVPIS